MKSVDSKYMKIDFRVSISHYSFDRSIDRINLTSDNQCNEVLSPEISKFLSYFFIDSTRDLVFSNKLLANKLIEKKKLSVKEIDVKKIIENITNRKYNMEFFFFENNLADISKILIKIFHNFDKEYKISTYKVLLSKLNEQLIQKNITDEKSKKSKKIDLFPKEILILSETFQLIKTLKLFIPTKVFNIYDYLFVLLNSRWLFPNALEIELDLESNLYNLVFNEDNAINARKLILSNKKAYFLMILFCYFVSTFENLNSFKLKMYDSYQIEIDCSLKERKVLINQFHLLDFFAKFKNLNSLDFDFNSIDSNTFERLLVILKRNPSIQSLTINFFPTDDSFFSLTSLAKISSTLGLSLNRLNTNLGHSAIGLGEDVLDEVEYILDKLIKYFERNMESLFFTLKMKEMSEITLKFDPPTVISSNEKYINIFHKFIINIFYALEVCPLQNLVLKTPHLFFDSVRNPGLISMIDQIDLENNLFLRNLNISAKFNKLTNIQKLIPYSLNFLNIGELDETSLNALYTNLDWTKFKDLACLKVVVSPYFFDLEGNIESFYNFFRTKKCKNLQQIYFKSCLQINNEQLNKIYSIIDGDSVGKYILQFSSKNITKEKFIYRHLLTHENDYKSLYCFIYLIDKLKYIKLKDKSFIGKIAAYTKKQKSKIVDLKLV